MYINIIIIWADLQKLTSAYLLLAKTFGILYFCSIHPRFLGIVVGGRTNIRGVSKGLKCSKEREGGGSHSWLARSGAQKGPSGPFAFAFILSRIFFGWKLNQVNRHSGLQHPWLPTTHLAKTGIALDLKSQFRLQLHILIAQADVSLSLTNCFNDNDWFEQKKI